jgi:protein-tyrosine phosphatase
MMAERILLVCTANECRSPYAESVLRSRLREAGVQGVVLDSAGIHVTPGRAMCATAAERLPDAQTSPAHRARALVPHDVEAADLILVAERRHRATIVRMSPAASARTFTLLEAAALGAASDPNGGPIAPIASIASGGSLGAFAARLHEARGLAGPIEMDIADAHFRRPRQHGRTLDRVEVAASAIADALLGREPIAPLSESVRRRWWSWLSRDGEIARDRQLPGADPYRL